MPNHPLTCLTLDTYQRGISAFKVALDGDDTACATALLLLHSCLEWATPEHCPEIWIDARLGLAQTYLLRQQGIIAENHFKAWEQCFLIYWELLQVVLCC